MTMRIEDDSVPCVVDGCEGGSYVKGMCAKHYHQNWKKTAKESALADTETLKKRILKYSMPVPFLGCWVWIGADRGNGYGVVAVGGKKRFDSAHRVSYKVFNGEIPDGMLICHKCDNKWCIHPDHLFLGTHVDNVQDMLSKGRARPPKGNTHPQAILDDSKVMEIRSSNLSGVELGKKYGVSPNTIYDVLKRRCWNHV